MAFSQFKKELSNKVTKFSNAKYGKLNKTQLNSKFVWGCGLCSCSTYNLFVNSNEIKQIKKYKTEQNYIKRVQNSTRRDSTKKFYSSCNQINSEFFSAF